jgi:hypothetical protein
MSVISMTFPIGGVLAQIMMLRSSATLFLATEVEVCLKLKICVSHWSYSCYSSLHLSAVRVAFVILVLIETLAVVNSSQNFFNVPAI